MALAPPAQKPFRPVWFKEPPVAEPPAPRAPRPAPPPPKLFGMPQARGLSALPSFAHLVPADLAEQTRRCRDALEASDAAAALGAFAQRSYIITMLRDLGISISEV